MSKVRFMWNNLADSASIISLSQHVNFPDDNVTHRWHTRTYRSQYGAGSGWGYFTIWITLNDRLDFEETVGVNLAAILTPGNYTADSLCAHLKAQMEAVGGSTYTWEYLEAGNDKNKFRVTSNGAGGGGILNLEWTGPNTARTIGESIGFDISVDDTGALTYTADSLRIHTIESVYFDFGSAQPVQAAIIKNNNFQSGATVGIYGGNTFPPTALAYVFGTINNDIMIYFWATPQNYRYWRVLIIDWDNPDGYIEIGRVFLGTYFSPTRGPKCEFAEVLIDPSDVLFSKGGQISSNEEEGFKAYDLTFPMASADLSTFNSIYEDRGQRKDMFVCIDTDNYATETYYMRFASSRDVEHIGNREEYWVKVRVEELR